MKRALSTHSLHPLLAAAVMILIGTTAIAICIPVPCRDCLIHSAGQLNFVVMDRSGGKIELIPNIRFTGDARLFALVVPTPGLPELSEAPGSLWDQAFALTAPLFTRGSYSDDGLACTSTGRDFVQPTPLEGDVQVHGQETVGAFVATILSSEDPGVLVRWLRDNEFGFTGEDSAKVAPLVEKGWYFTAMKLDTTQIGTEVPPEGWNTNVDPLRFSYEADELVLPLEFLSINREDVLPIGVFVVDDHRMDLRGFTTQYANRISASEAQEISRLYPDLASLVPPGRYLTRLDRTFIFETPMNQDVVLQRASSDEEFRRTDGRFFFGIGGSLPGQLLFCWLLLAGARRAFGAFRRRSPPSVQNTARLSD